MGKLEYHIYENNIEESIGSYPLLKNGFEETETQKKEGICIGCRYSTEGAEFRLDFQKLKNELNLEKLREFGLPFTDEVVRDFIGGAGEYANQFIRSINEDLSQAIYPAIMAEKNKIYGELVNNLKVLYNNVGHFRAKYKYIPLNLYFVDSNILNVDFIGADKIFNERAKICISNKQQIEAWKAATTAKKHLDELKNIVEKYGLSVFGRRGVLNIDECDESIEINPSFIDDCWDGGSYNKAL